MTLVSFPSARHPSFGVVKDGGAVDLGRRLGDRRLTSRPSSLSIAVGERRSLCSRWPAHQSLDWSLPRSLQGDAAQR